MVGLTDRRLKEKLQLVHELNLAKALEIASQHEQIKLQMRQQGGSTSSDVAAKYRYLGREEAVSYTHLTLPTKIGV